MVVHSKVNLCFGTIEKVGPFLNVQRVGQLNTLLAAVIFYFGRLASLFSGFVGLGFCF
jgi:hypothetical protein